MVDAGVVFVSKGWEGRGGGIKSLRTVDDYADRSKERQPQSRPTTHLGIEKPLLPQRSAEPQTLQLALERENKINPAPLRNLERVHALVLAVRVINDDVDVFDAVGEGESKRVIVLLRCRISVVVPSLHLHPSTEVLHVEAGRFVLVLVVVGVVGQTGAETAGYGRPIARSELGDGGTYVPSSTGCGAVTDASITVVETGRRGEGAGPIVRTRIVTEEERR